MKSDVERTKIAWWALGIYGVQSSKRDAVLTEDRMQRFNSQTASLSSCADSSPSLLAPTLVSVWQGTKALRDNGIGVLLTAILKRLPWTEDDIVARYDGCGWNDTTERRIFDDIATHGRRAIF